MELPNGYTIIERRETTVDPKTKQKSVRLLGYVIQREINGVEQFCGTDMSWRNKLHDVKIVQFFRSHKIGGETLSGPDYAFKMACWQAEQDDRTKKSRKGIKNVRIAESKLPICDMNGDVKSTKKVNVQLDMDQTKKVEGILKASRQNNLELKDGKPVASLADCFRAWLDSIEVK